MITSTPAVTIRAAGVWPKSWRDEGVVEAIGAGTTVLLCCGGIVREVDVDVAHGAAGADASGSTPAELLLDECLDRGVAAGRCCAPPVPAARCDRAPALSEG